MKRFFVFFLMFVVLFSSMSLGSSVEEIDEVTDTVMMEFEGNPRFTYLGNISVGLGIDENGYLTYSGTARTSGYDLRISLYLQRSVNGVFWDDLECYIKTGYNFVAANGSRYVSEGDYFYRAKIVAEVFDSNRNVIETATGYSSQERY